LVVEGVDVVRFVELPIVGEKGCQNWRALRESFLLESELSLANAEDDVGVHFYVKIKKKFEDLNLKFVK